MACSLKTHSSQAAHPRGCQYLPGDGVRVALVFKLPHVSTESGPRPVSLTAVSLMLADPVPDGAVRQASVSLLVASGEVSDLGAVDNPFGHAIAWKRTLPASAVVIATSCVLVVVATVDLDVEMRT